MQSLACKLQRNRVVIDETVVPGPWWRICQRHGRYSLVVARVNSTWRKKKPFRLPEPGMPANDDRHGNLPCAYRQRHLQPAIPCHDALIRSTAERPTFVLRQRQSKFNDAGFVLLHTPWQCKRDAVNGVWFQVERKLISMTVELEAAMANATGPRHHRVASPGDHRGRIFVVADQVIHAIVLDLRDTSTGLRRDRYAQDSVSDGDEWSWRKRRHRIRCRRPV